MAHAQNPSMPTHGHSYYSQLQFSASKSISDVIPWCGARGNVRSSTKSNTTRKCLDLSQIDHKFNLDVNLDEFLNSNIIGLTFALILIDQSKVYALNQSRCERFTFNSVNIRFSTFSASFRSDLRFQSQREMLLEPSWQTNIFRRGARIFLRE